MTLNGHRFDPRRGARYYPAEPMRPAVRVSLWLIVVGLAMVGAGFIYAATTHANAASADANARSIDWGALSGARGINGGHFVVRNRDRHGTVTRRTVRPVEGGGVQESIVTYPMDRPICSHGMGVLRGSQRGC